ncbi:hypothetical protein [Aeromicrobium sp. A1-2]|uniref:hypothetical protein n=1 Tax=Aeromicrobium sp. A1-2 TaxID=2107713 RepID=UPI0013C2E381|nr:hypothetical protein [Aeromicrobium sp. A1-2]
MKQQVAAGILAVSMVGGVGTGLVARQLSGSDPETKAVATVTTPQMTMTTSSPATPTASEGGASTKPSTPAALPLVPVTSLRIVAGAVGPVRVGMSKQEAYATGYFKADVTSAVCEGVDDLVWKVPYRDALDILTRDDGSVFSIGIHKAGPRTRSGLGVGSTYETVQGVLGDVDPQEAGYGQTGLFVSEGGGWIGFLFNPAPGEISANDKVTFIEVTRGAKPDVMRDGC